MPANFFVAAFLSLASCVVLFPGIQVPLLSIGIYALQQLDFLLHEIGHLGLGLFGQFVGALGGTLGQLFLPAATWLSAVRQRRRILISFFAFWFGENLVHISPYIADARAQQLALANPFQAFTGGEPAHDWHYLLSALHLLWADKFIGALVYAGGVLIMLLAIARLVAPDMVRRIQARLGSGDRLT